MACTPVGTGQRFVAEMLSHIDCQAQSIGAYGYGALAEPGSSVMLALTGLLTIFVAIFGIRLMIGEQIGGRDLLGDVLRIGIVLTLATSWPAWRSLGYDMIMGAPNELAASIGGASDLPGSRNDLTGRLQGADDGIVLLTVYGTGRNQGGTNRSDAIGDSFRGIALADQEGLANGRIAFLAGTIGPLAIVKLGAGLLLALTPLMAGLLLFAGTRDFFFGWLRALGAVALGSLAISMVLGVELAILEPWLRDALALRESQVLAPSAPTELTVITLAFAVASFGLLFLIIRVLFFGGISLPRLTVPQSAQTDFSTRIVDRQDGFRPSGAEPTRAFAVSEAVSQVLRREERMEERNRLTGQPALASASAATSRGDAAGKVETLGSSYRTGAARNYRRTSAAAGRRDDLA